MTAPRDDHPEDFLEVGKCPICDKGMTWADLAAPALLLGAEFRIYRKGIGHVVCCECTPRTVTVDGDRVFPEGSPV